MQKAQSKKQKWYDDPSIAEDSFYWKPKSEVWFWLTVLSFILTLIVNIFVPFKEVVNPHPYRVLILAIIALFLVSYIVALKKPTLRKKLYHKSQFFFAVGITLTIWDLLTTKSEIFPMPFFPGMVQVIDIMIQDKNLLFFSTIYSMRLFFVGLITGTLLGLTTGTLIGWWKQFDYWLSPIIKISGIIPAVAWIPVALVVFPNSFTTGVFLIFIASWFPVSSMMAIGILSTPRSYFEVARTLGATERFLLFRIAIPNAVPSIFMGILTATAFSFTTLIVSEMIGAKAGLGFYINWAKGWGAYSKVYAAIIIMGIEFSLILALIGAIRNYLLRWQKGILK